MRSLPDSPNDDSAAEHGANVVMLRGRVTAAPATRALPSGTTIVTLRLSMPREATAMTRGSRQTRDWVDCSAWTARMRRAALRWQEGDEVEVQGALRRRFQRVAGGPATTRVEVELLSGRVVSRGSTTSG